jgi:hypothetical protein
VAPKKLADPPPVAPRNVAPMMVAFRKLAPVRTEPLASVSLRVSPVKFRLGHVSNSSSTSHVIAWDGSIPGLREILLRHRDIFPTCWDEYDATPTQIIDLTAERMVITIKAPFKNGTKTWPLDGKSVVEDDVLGNTMKATARYEKGPVVGSGTVAWKGADVPLTLRRFIENGQMVQELVLLPKGQEPIVNRRVFSKK